MLKRITAFLKKYRLPLAFLYFTPQLTACSLLMSLLGLGLVSSDANQYPYRVETQASTAEANSGYYGVYDVGAPARLQLDDRQSPSDNTDAGDVE